MDAAEQARIDDEAAERLDQRHVRRGPTRDRLHVDGPIETVSLAAWDERCAHERVHGRVLNLAEHFVLERIDDTERAVTRARRHRRSRAQLGRDAMYIRLRGRRMLGAIPTEHLAEPE